MNTLVTFGAAAGAAFLGSVAVAQTELYIAEYQFNNAQISAVRTDGTGARALFALPSSLWLPIGLTYSPVNHRLYWMDSAGSSEILSANLDGSDQVVVGSTPGFAKGVSLDAAGRLYFSTDNTIRRMNADGSGLVTLYQSGRAWPAHPPRVDAVNGHLYFGDDGTIVRTNLDGGDVKVVVRGVSQARAVAVDLAERKIYWLDADTISDHVARANLDGTGFEIVWEPSPSVVQSSGLIDMVADPATRTLYVADELTNVVYRLSMDGGVATPIFTSAFDQSPSGMMLSTGEPAQPLNDCNGNGVSDDLELASGAADCDQNGVLDECQTEPCKVLDFLLDQGSDAANSSGRPVGVPSRYQVFQPFDVPPGGWAVGAIGLDGFSVNYHDGSGMSAKIFADNGTGERPDESELFAEATLNFRFNTNYENWVYAPMEAELPEGRYWMRLEAHDPFVFQSTLNFGFSGLASYGRGSSGNFSLPGPPIALRLVRAETCFADFNGDGFIDFFDYDDFVNCFENLVCPEGRTADVNRDGFVDFFDYDDFVTEFESGC